MELLRVGHSPDPDDAFMFFPLATGAVTIDGFQVEQVLEDIESLNQRAARGELEVTAISAGMYPMVADKYRIMGCGASVGRKYGPIVVTRQAAQLHELAGRRIAIPGVYTTAYLLFRIYMPYPFQPVFLPFDTILDAVEKGEADAGVIIHEGQLTWQRLGFHNVLDLGQAWFNDTGLPIPLGLDMVHRRLGEGAMREVTNKLAAAIRYTMSYEDDAVTYAMQYGRGIDRETCRQFVKMYVNQDTLDLGEEGRRALETLYQKAVVRGLIQKMPPLDIIRPE